MSIKQSKCSQCRRAGEKLFLKGEKCNSIKCPLLKRKYAPGQHGPNARRAKLSDFGKQLKEKQEAKRIYGMREKQFLRYVTEANKKVGDTGKILGSLLESRLDSVVFRMGLADSRKTARQMVGHAHMEVNGKKVDIPSFGVKVGDVISLRQKSYDKRLFENASERLNKAEAPQWLGLDAQKKSAKVLNVPELENPTFSIKDIIEFYSR